MLVPMTKDDIGVVHNYLIDTANKYGISLPQYSVLKHIGDLIGEDNAYIVQKDGLIVGAMIWEESSKDNWLTVFYILDGYKKNRDVIIPMYKKLGEKFLGKRLRYKPLHKDIENIVPCKSGIIDMSRGKAVLDRILGHGWK